MHSYICVNGNHLNSLQICFDLSSSFHRMAMNASVGTVTTTGMANSPATGVVRLAQEMKKECVVQVG